MKLQSYKLVSENFKLGRTPKGENLTISFALKNSVGKTQDDDIFTVLHECSCTITSEHECTDKIFTLDLCFAVWVKDESAEEIRGDELIGAFVTSTLKPLVHSEINSCLAKVKLTSIAYERLKW